MLKVSVLSALGLFCSPHAEFHASMTQLPTYDQLMLPLFRVLRDLGGSASIAETEGKVGELLQLPEAVLEIPHDLEKSNQTEFQYRLAWARTYGPSHKKYPTGLDANR